jgi:hypothetical protein
MFLAVSNGLSSDTHTLCVVASWSRNEHVEQRVHAPCNESPYWRATAYHITLNGLGKSITPHWKLVPRSPGFLSSKSNIICPNNPLAHENHCLVQWLWLKLLILSCTRPRPAVLLTMP